MPAKYTPEQRIAAFWSKVEQPDDPAQCWPRSGGAHPFGYTLFWDGKRQMVAHRYSFELAYGPVPEGLFVCHHCDNPACVRPSHLFLGTAKDNTHDMIDKGRAHQTFSEHPEVIPRGDRHYTRRNPELVRRGEDAGNAKLTNAQAHQIRARYAAGERGYKLAAEYGVSKAQVSRIVNHVDRRHA